MPVEVPVHARSVLSLESTSLLGGHLPTGVVEEDS